jgi:hypothetical protein
VLRERQLVLRRGFLQLGDALLEQRHLRVQREGEDAEKHYEDQGRGGDFRHREFVIVGA